MDNDPYVICSMSDSRYTVHLLWCQLSAVGQTRHGVFDFKNTLIRKYLCIVVGTSPYVQLLVYIVLVYITVNIVMPSFQNCTQISNSWIHFLDISVSSSVYPKIQFSRFDNKRLMLLHKKIGYI